MENTYKVTCSLKESDFIFHSGCFSHPEVPLFGFSVKRLSVEKDAGDIDINKPHPHYITIRYTGNVKETEEFPNFITFLMRFRNPDAVTEGDCKLSESEQQRYHFTAFRNGATMNPEDLKTCIKAYVPHESKYEPSQLLDQNRNIIPEREIWNNAVDEASLTDLCTENKLYFAEGYESGACAILSKAKEYISLQRKLEIAKNTMTCLATADFFPEDDKHKLMSDYWNTRKTICELKEQIETMEKYFNSAGN